MGGAPASSSTTINKPVCNNGPPSNIWNKTYLNNSKKFIDVPNSAPYLGAECQWVPIKSVNNVDPEKYITDNMTEFDQLNYRFLYINGNTVQIFEAIPWLGSTGINSNSYCKVFRTPYAVYKLHSDPSAVGTPEMKADLEELLNWYNKNKSTLVFDTPWDVKFEDISNIYKTKFPDSFYRAPSPPVNSLETVQLQQNVQPLTSLQTSLQTSYTQSPTPLTYSPAPVYQTPQANTIQTIPPINSIITKDGLALVTDITTKPTNPPSNPPTNTTTTTTTNVINPTPTTNTINMDLSSTIQSIPSNSFKSSLLSSTLKPTTDKNLPISLIAVGSFGLIASIISIYNN